MSSEALALEEELIRQSSVGLQKLPMLDVFFRRMPPELGAALRNRLGLSAEAEDLGMRYDSWAGLAGQMQGHTLSLEAEAQGWNGRVHLWLEPALLYAALERLMGGTGEAVFVPDRPSTAIERRLARSICDIAAGVFAETASGVTPVNLKPGTVEALAQSASAPAPATPCAAGVLRLRIGQTEGQMVVVLPMATLDPVLPALSTIFLGEKLGDASWRDHFRQNISASHVEVTAVMHEFQRPMSEILTWRPGDIVPLDLYEVPEIRLLCEGTEILYGAGGQCGDNHYAVSIEREAGPAATRAAGTPSQPFRWGVGAPTPSGEPG